MMTTSNKEIAIHREDVTAPRKSLGLYIHVPFCVRKCNYCDFLSYGGTAQEDQKAYFRSLTNEIKQLADIYGNKYYVDTIFIGGGTPSLVDERLIAELMETLITRFQITENAEISVESNPKTLTKNKLSVYLDAGINRLSIGAQSLDDKLLEYMGRVHTADNFLRNYEQARECGFRNINIDLMFAIPGQTLGIWTDTMERILTLRPEHISFYSLQIEEGTPFYSMSREGTLKQTEDDLDREMYHEAIRLLRDNGYEHYEISNAAREGYRCRHNLKYWSMEDYLGLGLGAHSFMTGTRFSNTTELQDYLKPRSGRLESPGGPYAIWRHENTREENISEYLFTGMRKIQGIELDDFKARYGTGLESLYGDILAEFQRKGLIEITGGRLRFTVPGIDISNRVLAEFV